MTNEELLDIIKELHDMNKLLLSAVKDLLDTLKEHENRIHKLEMSR